MRKLIKFGSDLSAEYSATLSQVTLIDMASSVNNDRWKVVEINRGGGANYNLVVLGEAMVAQAHAQGQVDRDHRSIFTSFPTLQADEDFNFEDTGVFEGSSVEANSMLSLEVLELPDGLPSNLTVELS